MITSRGAGFFFQGKKWTRALTHQSVDMFFCHVIGEQLHQVLSQVPVQLGLDVELVLKTFKSL